MSREPIVATIDDTMESFLWHPDQALRGRCLMSKLDDSIFLGVDEAGEYTFDQNNNLLAKHRDSYGANRLLPWN
jgi:hypothetical protein